MVEKENKQEVKNTLKIIKENHLDFIYDLHLKGVDVGPSNIEELKKKGYIQEEALSKEDKKEIVTEAINKTVLQYKTDKNRNTDQQVDIIQSSEEFIPFELITSDELTQRKNEYGHIFEGRKEPIKREEWAPKSATDHERDFIDWIDSINKHGIKNKINYRKFNLYVQQAYTWLSENISLADFDDDDIREDYKQNELKRCDENNLYFLNKYIWYKEGNAKDGSGKLKYVARETHEVLCYLDDCGYSIIIAKGRQQAITTTIMSINCRDVIFKTNHFMKFITEDDKKAVEIFDDKLKYPYSQLPDWMRPIPQNERDNLFKIGYKSEKGKKEGVGSKIEVVVPKRTAVAGGAPQKVLIDEAGNIPILGEMIGNARPTMYFANPDTKKLEITRKVWVYGCVCAGTKVWTNDGKLISIENLKQSDGILGYNGNSVNKEPIIWMKPPAKKPCYKITTEAGNTIECSNDHPLMWGKNGWKTSGNKKFITFKRADEVKAGDQLMMSEEINVFGKKKMWHPRLIGLMIGDGSYGITSTCEIGGQDAEMHDYLINNFNVSENKSKRYVTDCGKEYRHFNVKGIRKKLRELNIFGQTCDQKRLPQNIHEYDKESLSELIGGYFDADGNVCYNEKRKVVRIVLTSSIFELLNEVKFQLMKFGIASSIHKENRGKEEKKLSVGQKDFIYRLYINSQYDVSKFNSEIKLLCKHKSDTIKKVLNRKQKVFGTIRDGVFSINENGKGAYFLGNNKMNGIRFNRVKSVEFIGEKDVYNLNAGETHTYIANGFITANTGGEMDKGGKSFETEYMAIKKDWDERKFNTCIVPLFFNWRCRMFATEEQREMERQVAYGKAENKSDPKGKQHITEFYQSWPDTLEDVFRTSAKTLLDSEYIENQLKRIREAKIKNGHLIHQSGYFEPVYDTTSPVEDDVDPFKITGAVFVPTSDNDVRTSVTIFLHPKKEWADRYYQGTDPIDTDTGLSDFASSIWDDYFNTTAAILHWRIADYPQVFRQSMLMGIYYDDIKKQGIRELLESNRGSAYYQYQKNKGFGKRAVLNYELPEYLQNRTTKNEGVGIDSHGDRTQQLVNLQYNMFKTYGENFFHEILFEQSKTFVCRISDPNKVTGKGGGTQTWGPQNKKYFKDDTLWSTTYSYICAKMCFQYIVPKNIEVLKSSYKIVSKLVRGKDNTLYRTEVRERVYND